MAKASNVEFPGKEDRKKPGTKSPKRKFITMVKQTSDLRSLIDKVPIAIVLVDRNGKILHLNQEARSLFRKLKLGTNISKWPEELGLYLDDGMIPYPEGKLPVDLALQGGSKENEEIILRRPGESESLWISMSAQPLTLEDGSIDGAIVFARDISLRKQIEFSQEKQTQRTEALYRLSRHISEAGNNLDSLTQSIARFTSDVLGDLSLLTLKGNKDSQLKIAAYLDRNPTGQALMRRTMMSIDYLDEDRTLMGGVLKSGESLLIPAIDRERLKAISMPELREYIDAVGVQSVLIVPLIGRAGVLGAIGLYRHPGSEAFNADDQSFAMDIAYRTALAIENCRLFESLRLEIAERLSTKQRLDSSEERFRAIFEATTLGIKVLDLDGNLLQTNIAFQKMLGYSNAEFFGRHFSDFLFRADIPQALKMVKDLKSSGAPQYLFEHRAVAKDGSIVWLKTTFSPVYTGNGEKKMVYIVGILENVSERKQIEAQMKELRDRLQSNIELERLRLAQELHDNPMQSLYSVIYRIEELRAKAGPSFEEGLNKVTSEVQTVIDSLRATAQELRPPTIFDFGLENAIRSYVDDFSEKHPDLNISLSLAQDRQLLPEKIRLALFRIFQQSLMNVVRHADATRVKVRFAFDAEEVRLEISDDGQGFEVPSNWMEFVRHGHYGLAGAAERVDSLGGTFMVESKPGNTTTVMVTIPWKEFQSS
jgi:PAS domain S-box-containing protein